MTDSQLLKVAGDRNQTQTVLFEAKQNGRPTFEWSWNKAAQGIYIHINMVQMPLASCPTSHTPTHTYLSLSHTHRLHTYIHVLLSAFTFAFQCSSLMKTFLRLLFPHLDVFSLLVFLLCVLSWRLTLWLVSINRMRQGDGM